jgi:23S rRNA (uracil1939-C5)-methyltransferase
MTMQESLAQKEHWIEKQLKAWKETIEPIRSVEEASRWGYRRKVLLTARQENSRWSFGMIRRDEFIAIPGCPVHSEGARQLIRLLMRILPSSDGFPLAFLHLSDALATLVLKTKQKPPVPWLTEEVIHELTSVGIQGFWLHLNPSAGRRMFAKGGWHLLWGKDHACNKSGLIYGRTSFSQLIHCLHSDSIDEAEAFLNPGLEDCVADLYCGIGSSLIRWIKKDAKAMGIESGGEAVECALRNAPGAGVLRGTCRHRLPQLQQWLEENHKTSTKKLLYVNPPRTGIESEVLDWILGKMLPDKIVYLSCNAGTLKRDLEIITDRNYVVSRIIPYDFFPQTHHVECLVLVQKA